MTNSREPMDDLDLDLPAALQADLEALYLPAAPGQSLPALPASRPAKRGGRLHRLGRSRWALATAAGITALATALILPGALGTDTTHVSAQEILTRAQQAAANAGTELPSYHSIARTGFGGGGEEFLVMDTTETWYASPDRYSTITTSHADGLPSFGAVRNGQDTWLIMRPYGEIRVAHASQGNEGAGNFFLRGEAYTIDEVIAQATEGNCVSVAEDGKEHVAGREAYRVLIAPDANACPAGAKAWVPDVTMTLWVDTEWFVVLRSSSGGTADEPAYRYEVVVFEPGIDVPEERLTYTPPPGVEVIEAGPAGLKSAIMQGVDTANTHEQQAAIERGEAEIAQREDR